MDSENFKPINTQNMDREKRNVAKKVHKEKMRGFSLSRISRKSTFNPEDCGIYNKVETMHNTLRRIQISGKLKTILVRFITNHNFGFLSNYILEYRISSCSLYNMEMVKEKEPSLLMEDHHEVFLRQSCGCLIRKVCYEFSI